MGNIALFSLLLPGRKGFVGSRTTAPGSTSNADVDILSIVHIQDHSQELEIISPKTLAVSMYLFFMKSNH